MDDPLIPNNLADERVAAAFQTPEDLAARAGIPASRLYLTGWRQIIGIDGVAAAAYRRGAMFRNWADHGHMLMPPTSAPGSTAGRIRTNGPTCT